VVAIGTIHTLPQQTLPAFANHDHVEGGLPADGVDAEAVIEALTRAGVDESAMVARPQREGIGSVAASWHALWTRFRDTCASSQAASRT
jgi:transaldolase